MTTAASPGHTGRLAVSTDGGTTYYEIAEQQDLAWSSTRGKRDATSRDSNGNKEHLAGEREVSVSGSCLYVDTNVAQQALLDADEAGTMLAVRFRYAAALSGENEWKYGRASVTSCQIAPDMAGVVKMTYSLDISGAGARSNQ